jgi:hypothetical protein
MGSLVAIGSEFVVARVFVSGVGIQSDTGAGFDGAVHIGEIGGVMFVRGLRVDGTFHGWRRRSARSVVQFEEADRGLKNVGLTGEFLRGGGHFFGGGGVLLNDLIEPFFTARCIFAKSEEARLETRLTAGFFAAWGARARIPSSSVWVILLASFSMTPNLR